MTALNHSFRCLAVATLTVVLSLLGHALADGSRPAARSTAASPQFVQRVFRDDAGEHRYVVALPQGFSHDRKWPVILFLHGAGERGTDARRPLEVGIGPILKQHPEAFPAIVVFPQAEELHDRILTTWEADHPDGARALKILADVEAHFPCDPQRRILTGWSMGGYGVWSLAAASQPGFWSAALALAGGASEDVAARLPADLPFWAIHGADDRLVRESEMNLARVAAKHAGREIFTTTIPNFGHDAWKVAYATPEVQQWLFDPTAVDPASVSWDPAEIDRLVREASASSVPFVPGTIISHAIAVRIDNAAFAEIARGIPGAIPQERLEGQVPDIVRNLDYDGTKIRASIHSIRWSTSVESVEIVAAGAEELQVTVQLRNLTLRPGGAQVQGGQYRATTGPFEIVIAPFKPIAVRTVLRPTVVDGAIALKTREIDFEITDDNWFIREPEFATASGPDLTPDLVKTGIVGGLYRSRTQVEETVRELIPGLIKRVEERLAMVPPASVASLLWPLPTNPPDIRLRPEAIRTDRAGVSVTLAIVIARTEPSEATNRIALTSPINERETQGVSIGVAPGVVGALAEVFRRTNESHLDVLDAPEPAFARLASPELLLRAAPDLSRFVEQDEFRTELKLAAPFELRLKPDAAAGDQQAIGLQIVAPRLLLTTYRRPKGHFGQGVPCLEVAMSLTQDLDVQLMDATATARRVQVRWGSVPDIRGVGEFTKNHDPDNPHLDAAPIIDAFREAWTAWTSSMETVSEVADFTIGEGHLRLDALPVSGERVWLRFEPPADQAAAATAQDESPNP